jgi:hypothetical protein
MAMDKAVQAAQEEVSATQLAIRTVLSRNENHEGLPHDFVRISTWANDRLTIDPVDHTVQFDGKAFWGQAPWCLLAARVPGPTRAKPSSVRAPPKPTR